MQPSAGSRNTAWISEFQSVGPNQIVFTTWLLLYCVGPLEKYDCICFVVIPQFIEWVCVAPATGTTTRDPQLPQSVFFSRCSFTNSLLIDHYYY